MKRSIKKFMLTALLLCVTVLLGSCSFLEGEQQPQVQNYSELTQTEVFPVRLEIGEQSYLISSKPHSFAVLSADLAQALEDMGVASMITALCSDAPAGISSSARWTAGRCWILTSNRSSPRARTGCWSLPRCARAAWNSWSRRGCRSSS